MFFLLALALLAAVNTLAQQPCPQLASTLRLAKIEVRSAQIQPARQAASNVPAAPERCVVQATARPTKDSEIQIEVWLPVNNWNGKYLQSGNGGWAGAIPLGPLAHGASRGYATAATDNGHKASGPESSPAAWAVGHPEKLIDFGHRALQQTTHVAKAAIEAFYGRPAARAYFVGCSDGGREALMEAQRYPEDFDGIIAGAPANDWTRLFTGFIWNEQALATAPIPVTKLPAIQNAVLAACDKNDGVADGLIENPASCQFNPEVLACKSNEDNDTCLTQRQIVALKKIYEGPRHPETRSQIFPGYPPGHEATPGAWAPWIIPTATNPTSIQASFGNSFYGQAVFERSTWDFKTLNFDTDLKLALEKAAPATDSTSPDLRSFRANGGKLIQYHGWADAAISPFSSIHYYEKVRAFLATYPSKEGNNSKIEDFYRLFMVPGMGHCGGGYGPNSFGQGIGPPRQDPDHDAILALERWVEQGVAPERFIASGIAGLKVNDKAQPVTRPLCVYPKVATFNGAGDPAQAQSFTCKAP
jgi:feruloyl esterase